MNIKLKLVSRINYKRPKWKNGLLWVIALTGIVAALVFSFTEIKGLNYLFLGLLVLFSVVWVIFHGQDSDKMKEIEVPDNHLKLCDNSISVRTEKLETKIDHDNIRYVRISYYGYYGEMSGKYTRPGSGNYIRIKTSTQMLTFEFFLANISQRKVLFRYLQHIERSGIKLYFKNEWGVQSIYKHG